jgi:hypothetical protein
MPIDTEELYLDANDIQEIPLELSNRLIYLARIDLSYNKLRALPANVFSNLTRLETLILSYNKIQCIESTSFKGLKNLRILYVFLVKMFFLRDFVLDHCMEMKSQQYQKVHLMILQLYHMCK